MLLGVLAAPGCQESQAPLAPAAEVIVTPAPGALIVGDTLRLRVRVLDAQGDSLQGRTVAWASSDPDIATVSATGLVTAVAGGAVVISAASEAIAGAISVTIVAPLSATAVFSGSQSAGTCAILAGGSVRCWGPNFSGALGIGVVGGVFTVPVPQQAGPVPRIALGQSHGCGIAQGDALSCWGGNVFGEVGDSSRIPRVLPVPVRGGGGYTEVGTGFWLSCGLRTGDWYCWGSFLPASNVPLLIGSGPYHGLGVGESHACALQVDDTAWCAGSGFVGQLGDDGTSYQSAPVPVAGGHHFASLALGGRHTCGIDLAGATWCWGVNLQGALGDGTTADRSHPVAVTGGPVFASLSAGGGHSCGLTSAGVAWCWGDNSSGQLGDGTTTGRLVPTAIGGTLRFIRLAAGAVHTCGIAVDGRVYCWGNNDQGSLGDGSTTGRPLPTLVHAS
jgi:hypothetical protein